MYEVSFLVSQEKLSSVLGVIASEVSGLRVSEAEKEKITRFRPMGQDSIRLALKLLEDNRVWSYAEIAEAFANEGYSPKTAGSALFTLAGKGLVKKLSRGSYQRIIDPAKGD